MAEQSPFDSPYVRPFIPAADQLASQTQADNDGVALAWPAFLALLVADARVRALFDTWDRSHQLSVTADAVAAARACVVDAEVVEAEAQVHGAAVGLVLTALKPVHQLLARWKAFAQRPDPDPETFVRETLKLPWPWIAFYLADHFYRGVESRAYGTPTRVQFRVYVLAPKFGVVPQPGESCESAVRRLQGEMTRLHEHARQLPPGRRSAFDLMTRNVTWFYRAHVQDPPDDVPKLAREYHATVGHKCEGEHHSGGDRDTVQNGINRARHFLALGAFRYPGDPAQQ
jgi:hypothetical protein